MKIDSGSNTTPLGNQISSKNKSSNELSNKNCTNEENSFNTIIKSEPVDEPEENFEEPVKNCEEPTKNNEKPIENPTDVNQFKIENADKGVCINF